MFLANILRNALFLSMGCLIMASAMELEVGDEFAGDIEEFAPTQREDFSNEGIIDNAEMPGMAEEVAATSKPRIGGIRSRKDNSPLLIALQPKKGIQDETATTGVNADAAQKRLPPTAVMQQEPDPLLIHHVMVGYPLPLDLYEQAE